MRYVSRLDPSAVVEATHGTHSLWSDGRTELEHTTYNEEQLARAGDRLLRYVGLVDDAGHLVASSKRYSLALRGPRGETLRTMGIGAVFVPAAHRGHDSARTLIRHMMDEARDLGDAAAWLYSDIAPSFYEHLGFRAEPAFEHIAITRDLPREKPFGVSRVEDDDAIRIATQYRESIEPSFVEPLRSLEVLRYFVWRNQAEVWRLDDRAREVGYFATSPNKPEDGGAPAVWIDEWSAPDVGIERVLATFRAFAEVRGLERIASWLRPDRDLVAFHARPRAKAIPMIAALGDDAWLMAIDPAHAHFGSLDHF